MNENTLNILGYDELKNQIKNFCMSNLGKTLLDKLVPFKNIRAIEKRLRETSEARYLIDHVGNIPLYGVYDINPFMEKVRKGNILQPEELIIIVDFLRGCRRIKKFMKNQTVYAPTLSQYTLSVLDLNHIEDVVNASIKNSMVDSNASKDLAKIRKKIYATEEKIQRKLKDTLISDRYKNYIQDHTITIKNDRYTIPFKASYKNKVDGNVVKLSSKGNTVFIEPKSICKFNDELNFLKTEEKAEEYQILAYITGIIAESLYNININIEFMGQFDMIVAKAKYSSCIKGIAPVINESGYIDLINVRHPLMEEECKPLNITIGKENRGVIITGPNAGGKTVALKTIGLSVLAVQSGIHIPAQIGSVISLFDKIYVEIGDNQSIANSLSTFSSHIKNIASIISNANKSSLVLIDEIGTGTEPNEGACLAIAILEELYLKGAIIVGTTHYERIKNYSKNHPHFINAHMKFDPNTLEPLYELIMGKSGTSNAFWISKKFGIHEKVLSRAKAYMYDEKYKYEMLDNNKIRTEQKKLEAVTNNEYLQRGDSVILLDGNKKGIVYKEKDKFNNIEVMVGKEFITVNIQRVRLNIKREYLYPPNYHIETLFKSYESLKEERDIKRGSKKTLKAVHKEIKNNKHKYK